MKSYSKIKINNKTISVSYGKNKQELMPVIKLKISGYATDRTPIYEIPKWVKPGMIQKIFGGYGWVWVTAATTSTTTSKSTSTSTSSTTTTLPPNLTQADFRYYEDGTESGSTAIDTQGTNITRNVSSDSNLQLRIRLQETAGTSGNSTDDYQLQVSVNSGSWSNVST